MGNAYGIDDANDRAYAQRHADQASGGVQRKNYIQVRANVAKFRGVGPSSVQVPILLTTSKVYIRVPHNSGGANPTINVAL